MAVEVILPRVDMDMTTGIISKWHARDGDAVKKGAVLFEIETDKAAMEIECPADGILKIGNAPEKSVLPIGAVVAMIFAAGEAVKELTVATSVSVTPAKAGAQLAAKLDSRLRGNDEQSSGTRATPLARRIARDSGIALSDLRGSGPRGRIVASDVKTPPKPADDVRGHYEAGSFTEKPLDGMRRTIAQRLTLSKQTIPHFYLTSTCVIDELLTLRERLNSHAPRAADKSPLWKLSINDFIIKALGLALQRVPAANVTFAGDSILQHHVSDVGVAVAVDGGLFTPVLRSVETKMLAQISAEMKELATRAKARKLQPPEYQGGTTAISNLGMFGVEQFNAIINPPQATILAVGAGIAGFVPVNGLPVLKTRMKVTLACDHRAVDGAVGAELLAAFKALVEEPALMLV